jgi:hypothetical protein
MALYIYREREREREREAVGLVLYLSLNRGVGEYTVCDADVGDMTEISTSLWVCRGSHGRWYFFGVSVFKS